MSLKVTAIVYTPVILFQLHWSFKIKAMDTISIFFVLLFVPLGWYWLDSLRALEIARNLGKQICHDANVQFLDDTVARISLALARSKAGRRVFDVLIV